MTYNGYLHSSGPILGIDTSILCLFSFKTFSILLACSCKIFEFPSSFLLMPSLNFLVYWKTKGMPNAEGGLLL